MCRILPFFESLSVFLIFKALISVWNSVVLTHETVILYFFIHS